MLDCPFAKEELKKHLSSKYGDIENVYINDIDLNSVLRKVDLIVNSPEMNIVPEDLSISLASNSKTIDEVESDAESIESLLAIHTTNFKEGKSAY